MPKPERILDSSETVAALLGLSGNPKVPDPAKGFFFETPLITQQLATLNRLVDSSTVILVMGERGSGKSTLVRQMVSISPDQWVAGRLSVKAQNKSHATSHGRLNQRMVFFTKRQTIPSIIVDNAHQLSDKELELLIRATFSEGRGQQLKSVVLVGEPELRQRLKTAAKSLPSGTVIEKIHLAPFSEQETVDYLVHRIRKAGLLSQVPFSKKQVKIIHSLSGGLPGCINGQAFLLLKEMKLRRAKRRQLKSNLTFGLVPATTRGTG